MKNLRTLFPVAILLAAFACENNSQDIAPPSLSKDPVLAYIKKIGYKDIDIEETNSAYIVEGDMVFPKKMIVPDLKNLKPDQHYIGLISFAAQNNIRVMIDASMSSMSTEINDAISQWNSISYNGKSRIRFSIVTSGSYEVLISDVNLGDYVCGTGQYPSGGAPGSTININKSWISGNSYDQRRRTIIHELGHTIGFDHTNNPLITSTAVPGYGGTDSNSLMNGGQCNTGATVFSTNDKEATYVLYPTDYPRSLSYNSSYPIAISWAAPLYSGQGGFVDYEYYYVVYPQGGSPVTSQNYTSSTASYTFPFTSGQYSGASLVTYVRSRYSSGYNSGWTSYNTTLY